MDVAPAMCLYHRPCALRVQISPKKNRTALHALPHPPRNAAERERFYKELLDRYFNITATEAIKLLEKNGFRASSNSQRCLTATDFLEYYRSILMSPGGKEQILAEFVVYLSYVELEDRNFWKTEWGRLGLEAKVYAGREYSGWLRRMQWLSNIVNDGGCGLSFLLMLNSQVLDKLNHDEGGNTNSEDSKVFLRCWKARKDAGGRSILEIFDRMLVESINAFSRGYNIAEIGSFYKGVLYEFAFRCNANYPGSNIGVEHLAALQSATGGRSGIERVAQWRILGRACKSQTSLAEGTGTITDPEQLAPVSRQPYHACLSDDFHKLRITITNNVYHRINYSNDNRRFLDEYLAHYGNMNEFIRWSCTQLSRLAQTDDEVSRFRFLQLAWLLLHHGTAMFVLRRLRPDLYTPCHNIGRIRDAVGWESSILCCKIDLLNLKDYLSATTELEANELGVKGSIRTGKPAGDYLTWRHHYLRAEGLTRASEVFGKDVDFGHFALKRRLNPCCCSCSSRTEEQPVPASLVEVMKKVAATRQMVLIDGTHGPFDRGCLELLAAGNNVVIYRRRCDSIFFAAPMWWRFGFHIPIPGFSEAAMVHVVQRFQQFYAPRIAANITTNLAVTNNLNQQQVPANLGIPPPTFDPSTFADSSPFIAPAADPTAAEPPNSIQMGGTMGDVDLSFFLHDFAADQTMGLHFADTDVFGIDIQ
ncbi:hypothetical protein HK097_007343 [Rhizophlyctis rosea]|uniref:Uncharacterized protein n=1 Tax=Rhizophlyctis rosea TaxID=64517 RepID=A0AAD5SDZ7_9FUNG|nr:hypothetical protein HK097_007343 [Rhizophlyctis rosea]